MGFKAKILFFFLLRMLFKIKFCEDGKEFLFLEREKWIADYLN